MQTVHIGPATTDDYDWCAHVMESSDPWITLRRDLNACRQVLTRPGTELFLARDQKTNHPMGFILVAPHGLAGSPYIASIAVASEARGRGVGTELIGFAERQFDDRDHIFLLVSSFNQRAQQFYRRHGYECVGELKDYIVAGHSELIFHKCLS